MKIDISPNAKRAALWIFLAFALILLINYMIKSINKLKAAAEAKKENEVNGASLSADLKQYTIYADKLEESIGAFSTDESAVYQVFNAMQNNDDVKQLIKSFGSRTFTLLIGKCTLPAYIQNGMSESEIAKINDLLSNKSITIQF